MTEVDRSNDVREHEEKAFRYSPGGCGAAQITPDQTRSGPVDGAR